MKINLLAAFMCFASMTFAAQVELQMPVYNGSGCEPGSVEPIIGPNRNMIHFATPNYEAKAGERKTCMMVLPVQAAPHTEVTISSIGLKTSSLLPENSTGVFQAELFLAGFRAPVMNLLFEGPLAQEDVSILTPKEDEFVWSGCGQSANLRVNSSLSVTRGSIQVVSLRVRLKTRPC